MEEIKRGFQATRIAKTSGGVMVSWGATHRSGYCCICGTFLEYDPAITSDAGWSPDNPESEVPPRNFCYNCEDYRMGQLISRQVSIEPPAVPTCLTPSCLWRYLKDAWLYALVCNYHARRMTYAEANRHNQIPERYRTGEPSPKTLWQAICANIKLSCPVCRKY